METRIVRLERLVKALAGLLAVTIGGMVFVLVQTSAEHKEPTHTLDVSVVNADSVNTGHQGLSSKTKVEPDGTAEAFIRTTPLTAAATVGLGKNGISIVAQKGPVVMLSAFGDVDSDLEINTSTGQWSVVQRSFDAARKVTAEKRTPLVPAL